MTATATTTAPATNSFAGTAGTVGRSVTRRARASRSVALRRLLGSFIALALLALWSGASAQDCERGALDERFCDVAGDLLADAPSDPSALRDPSTLVFTYAPTEDPAVYQEA